MKYKLRIILKNTYKSIIILLFQLIYGKIKLSKKKIKKIKIESELFNKRDKYYSYQIDNARIFTDANENVSVIKDNNLLDEVSFQQINGKIVKNKFNQVLKTGTPRRLIKIKGNTLLLAQGGSGYTNYCHWLLDILPRLYLFLLSNNKKKLENIFLNKPNNVQKEMLIKFGFGDINFINSKKFKHIKVEKLIYCTHPNYQKGTIMEAHSKIPSWIIKLIKNKLINKKKTKTLGNKIFIDRSDSKFSHCKLINNSFVKNYLFNKGFKIIKLSNLSFKKQIEIFNNSKLVIAPHGAGLANLIFCRKNTNVIEIKPANHPNKVYETICKINKLNYKLIKLPQIKNNSSGDMNLEISLLKKCI
jgi:capsular polysaccharide biosynthesis protein